MAKAERLTMLRRARRRGMTFGVFATCDPRLGASDRRRATNIVQMAADVVADRVRMPDGRSARVVWTPVLVDGEKQADIVAQQFLDQGVQALVCVPDTWAFPQPSLISLIQQFPDDTPINLTCGNSGPKPGVVFTHAASGALSQYGKLVHINVGVWPDRGQRPKMTDPTADALADWCYAALAAQSLRGRRVVIWGHDSMGMETALAHVIPARRTLGLEITRLDMKLLADMVRKGAYDKQELKALRGWIDNHVGRRLEIRTKAQSELFDQSLTMYLIVRDVMDDLSAVGGGFMSQLEWGSDRRGIPMPVADVMESLFNSTFDHKGRKPVIPYATEADVQGLLTMLYFTYLSGGNPPLFMDFRKVWEPWEVRALAEKLRVERPDGPCLWWDRGVVDGNNSGSASFDWAAGPGADVEDIMARVGMPQAAPHYFPGGGNSVTFLSPGDIECIAGRMAYSADSGMFSLIWDQAVTVELPEKLAREMCQATDPTWPHTFITPRYATMAEYKQFAPANHVHATWDLAPARIEYWMDMANVLSCTPWAARPEWIEGVDRPKPLLHIINGGEAEAKRLRHGQ